MVVVVNKTRNIKNVEIKKPIEKKKIVEKTQSRIKGKSKEKSNKASGNSGGLLDEKGYPYPIESKDGGDPICEGDFILDNGFDPFNDPINPQFRCIPALKDPDDIKNKIMNSLKNPSGNVTAPSAGGGRGARSYTRRARSPHRHARSYTRRARSSHRHARSHTRRARSHVGRNKKI